MRVQRGLPGMASTELEISRCQVCIGVAERNNGQVVTMHRNLYIHFLRHTGKTNIDPYY